MNDDRDNRYADSGDAFSNLLGPTKANVQALNVMMLAAPFSFGSLSVVAVVFAYVNRGSASNVISSHYSAIIKTFWVGLIGGLISLVLMFFLIGLFTGFAVFLWWMIRSVQSLAMVSRGEPIDNPSSLGLLR